jgi:hypothetical protein
VATFGEAVASSSGRSARGGPCMWFFRVAGPKALGPCAGTIRLYAKRFAPWRADSMSRSTILLMRARTCTYSCGPDDATCSKHSCGLSRASLLGESQAREEGGQSAPFSVAWHGPVSSVGVVITSAPAITSFGIRSRAERARGSDARSSKVPLAAKAMSSALDCAPHPASPEHRVHEGCTIEVVHDVGVEEDPYERTWTRMRRQGTRYWAGIGLSLFVGFAIMNPPIGPLSMALTSGVICTLLLSVTALYMTELHLTKCPRCGAAFAGTGLKRILFPGPKVGVLPTKSCASCGLSFGALHASDASPPREMFPSEAVPKPAALAVTMIFLGTPPFGAFARSSIGWALALLLVELVTAGIIVLVLKATGNSRSRLVDVSLSFGFMAILLTFHHLSAWSFVAVIGGSAGLMAVLAGRSLGLLRQGPPNSGNLVFWSFLAAMCLYLSVSQFLRPA